MYNIKKPVETEFCWRNDDNNNNNDNDNDNNDNNNNNNNVNYWMVYFIYW